MERDHPGVSFTARRRFHGATVRDAGGRVAGGGGRGDSDCDPRFDSATTREYKPRPHRLVLKDVTMSTNPTPSVTGPRFEAKGYDFLSYVDTRNWIGGVTLPSSLLRRR